MCFSFRAVIITGRRNLFQYVIVLILVKLLYLVNSMVDVDVLLTLLGLMQPMPLL